MNCHESTLDEMLERYGPDFLKKLPMYKTAVFAGRYVRIIHMDVAEMRAEIENQEGSWSSVPVLHLDCFVL